LGCSTIEPVAVTILNDCVWPGDADNNNVANNFDLLPIGIFYSQTGPLRSITSNNWQPFNTTDWATVQPGGADIKHVDCNGDGTIDSNDTLAINDNFGSNHPDFRNQIRSTDPEIYFVTSANTYNPGDWIDAEVWIGKSINLIDSLYGVAFNFSYDPTLVEPLTESLNYPAGFIGTPNTNAITFSRIDQLSGAVYAAITRTNHTNVNGYGKIADFRFQAKTSITVPSVMMLNIGVYAANDSVGSPVWLTPIADSINIVPLSTSLSDLFSSEIKIYPNPFNTQTTITFNKEQKNTVIRITDVVGKQIKEINFAGKQLEIERGEMSKGIYFIEVMSEDKTVVKKKIVVQ
jgi:hypothetical protein